MPRFLPCHLALLLLLLPAQGAAAAQPPFSLPSLPYPVDALEPAVDATTTAIRLNAWSSVVDWPAVSRPCQESLAPA